MPITTIFLHTLQYLLSYQEDGKEAFVAVDERHVFLLDPDCKSFCALARKPVVHGQSTGNWINVDARHVLLLWGYQEFFEVSSRMCAFLHLWSRVLCFCVLCFQEGFVEDMSMLQVFLLQCASRVKVSDQLLKFSRSGDDLSSPTILGNTSHVLIRNVQPTGESYHISGCADGRN